MGLTLEEANRILSGALAKAQELNIKISASVCDAGGRPVAFQRMDNAIWASAYASQGKAVASAAFGRPSGEMAERADQPTPRGVAAAEGGHMIMGQGAVPIIGEGVVEGACGGSGAERKDCCCKMFYRRQIGSGDQADPVDPGCPRTTLCLSVSVSSPPEQRRM